MGKYYLSMDLGGTNLRYGAVGEDLQVMEFHRIPSEAISDAPDKAAFIEEVFRPMLDSYGREDCLGVALCLASLMDRDRTMNYSSPNLRGFDNIPLGAMVEEAMGLPVCMERDANAGLLYEIHRAGIPSEGIIMGIFAGTGLGAAMCIDGRVYVGATGSAIELGHIPVPGLQRRCGCGKDGCIELLGSGAALREAADALGCPIEQVFTRCGQEPSVASVVEHMALAVAAGVTILDPAYVVLGGGVMEMEGFPMEVFQQTVRDNVRCPNPRESLEFIISEGDDEAGVVGAVINMMNKKSFSKR